MRNRWDCYVWQGSASAPRGDTDPFEDWSSPEGAIEFLRRQLEDHDLYSKETLVSALTDLRQGGWVTLCREIEGGEHLHLEVIPQGTY